MPVNVSRLAGDARWRAECLMAPGHDVVNRFLEGMLNLWQRMLVHSGHAPGIVWQRRVATARKSGIPNIV
jgi:hypothetical protein